MVPGDRLVYTATIDSLKPEGIAATVTGERNGEHYCAADLLFTRIDDPATDRPNANLLAMARWMRVLGVFTVGVAADAPAGRPGHAHPDRGVRDLTAWSPGATGKTVILRQRRTLPEL